MIVQEKKSEDITKKKAVTSLKLNRDQVGARFRLSAIERLHRKHKSAHSLTVLASLSAVRTFICGLGSTESHRKNNEELSVRPRIL